MPKRGMEAVASKQQDMQRELRAKLKRKAVMQRKGKGPGVAVMIAIGKPKSEKGEMGEKDEPTSKAEKIAELEEKIGYLKAELALLKGDEAEMEDESKSDEDMDEESEEYED